MRPNTIVSDVQWLGSLIHKMSLVNGPQVEVELVISCKKKS